MTRARATVAGLLALLVLAAGCGAGVPPGGGSLAAAGIDLSDQTYTVGSKEFDEQLVLCAIQIEALRSVGATVVDRCRTGDTAQTRSELLDGRIDLYWSYTGTGWEVDLGRERLSGVDADDQLAAVREADAANGIVWTERTPFDNTYAIATSAAFADANGLRTITDLAALARSGRADTAICVEPEFAARPDSLPRLRSVYGFPDRAEPQLPAGSIYQAVANATPCTAGEVFTTDGRVAGLDLRVLDDVAGVFPRYNAATTIRRDVVDRDPDVVRVSDEIARRLDDATMLGLNGQVSAQGLDPRRVATDWLRQQGLIARGGT